MFTCVLLPSGIRSRRQRFSNMDHRDFFSRIFEHQVFPKSEPSLRRLALSKYDE